MRYLYVGEGRYLANLPARDLDDVELSDDQKEVLKVGIRLGLYKPAKKERSANAEESGSDSTIGQS